MFIPKNVRFILLSILFSFMQDSVGAQNADELNYQHKIQLIDSLSLYKMDVYDTLSHISILTNLFGDKEAENYYGWIGDRNKDHITFLKINGKALELDKKEIIDITPMSLNQAAIDSILARNGQNSWLDWGDFAYNSELVLWLYKKGQSEYSRQVFASQQTRSGRYISLNDSDLREGFGAVYYDAMLEAFCYRRNFQKAIALGEHLSSSVFRGYEHQKDAIELTRQLKNNTEDFKKFHLPDSSEWSELKQKLSRKEQIFYLGDRLRLLNCIQPGQPAGISYTMYQYTIPYFDAEKLNIDYWRRNSKYGVINPFVELLMMKLSLSEIELLLPYLLTDTYIASYSYHRDFFSERSLHKLSWVIHDLIFEITSKSFFDQRTFDAMTVDQKKVKVAEIKKWCDANAALSREQIILNVLRTTDQWVDFCEALETAKQAKYDSLMPAIIPRFNDFKEFYWQVHKYAIAQTMYELGNEKYVPLVRKWNKEATQTEVRFWTSMFLVKYDKENNKAALRKLEAVFKESEGPAYYPDAMHLLLSMNSPKAFKLAEGIMDQSDFQRDIYWDYNEGFVRKLLLAKSDRTFNLLTSKLDSCTSGELKNSALDISRILTKNNSFVLAVDELKSDTPAYYNAKTDSAKLEYIKTLSKWFKNQYALLKEGKPNEMHLNVKQAGPPVGFVDSADR